MALVAGVQTILTSYNLLYSQLQTEICDITEALTDSAEQVRELTAEAAAKRKEVREGYDHDSSEYNEAMGEVNDAYNATLAEIQAWEADLESQKDEKEMRAETYASYIGSYEGILSDNISDSFTFGAGVGGGGS